LKNEHRLVLTQRTTAGALACIADLKGPPTAALVPLDLRSVQDEAGNGVLR
jgi:hypothetical protein